MAYLNVAGEYERVIQRGIFSHRSNRLDAVLAAIDRYIKDPSGDHLRSIETTFNEWKSKDPKEFADRGQNTEGLLRSEIREISGFWHLSIPIVDPDAHPTYQPGLWNDGGMIQLSTNCYAYACNDPFDHPLQEKPQPGQLAEKQVISAEGVTGENVRLRVMIDDLSRSRLNQEARLIPLIRLRKEAAPDYVVNVPGYYLVALVVAPTLDYHWLRQDRDGMWSHKPGHERVTRLDSYNSAIYDPRDATVEIYGVPYEFATFYYVPKGGVRTGSLGARQAENLKLWHTAPRTKG